MTEIQIENLQDKIDIPEALEETIRQVVEKTLEMEECEFDAEVSVTIVDNAEIQALNREHRDKDAVTDVLSFPILEFDETGEIVDCEFDFDGERVMLGDIVLCAERAREQAAEYGHSFKREMAFLVAHSMLHLLGYDHVDDPAGEAVMCQKQEAVLSGLGITRE